jgi:hypothetical protein
MKDQQENLQTKIIPAVGLNVHRLYQLDNFTDGYKITELTDLDPLVDEHDDIRVAFICAHPDSFVG